VSPFDSECVQAKHGERQECGCSHTHIIQAAHSLAVTKPLGVAEAVNCSSLQAERREDRGSIPGVGRYFFKQYIRIQYTYTYTYTIYVYNKYNKYCIVSLLCFRYTNTIKLVLYSYTYTIYYTINIINIVLYPCCVLGIRIQ